MKLNNVGSYSSIVEIRGFFCASGVVSYRQIKYIAECAFITVRKSNAK